MEKVYAVYGAVMTHEDLLRAIPDTGNFVGLIQTAILPSLSLRPLWIERSLI